MDNHDEIIGARVEIREIRRAIHEIQVDLKGLRVDLSAMLPNCAVHDTRLDHVERGLARRTLEGRVIGGIAAAVAAIAAALGLGGGKP